MFPDSGSVCMVESELLNHFMGGGEEGRNGGRGCGCVCGEEGE